ncbi:MAG: M23 family metallopeptidase, partial [Dysosmobacter sp.]|nr:M23 family metallopeptidase [Dysosmobacter sp.]
MNYKRFWDGVPLPQGLEDRVLRAAEERPARHPFPWKRTFRAAACALCALALVVGTVRVTHPAEGGVVLSYDFALRACAADETVNGRLAFLPGEGRSENGTTYTGCLFRLEGENIKTVTLQVEAGGLYRDGYFTDLGQSLTEDYDPEARYGFCLPEGQDLSAFDGTALTVAVTFTDGTQRSQRYPLRQEQLLACAAAEGEAYRPALSGEGGETALYAASPESRFLLWPVRGANAVRLSQDFENPDQSGVWTEVGFDARVETAEDGGTVMVVTYHAAIDIPGESGTPILAAADGTVRETGFDAEKGNYLILDHGDGLTTLYAQCREVLVMEGQQVAVGDAVAEMGSTGGSTGPHLHFAVLQDGVEQPPLPYFDAGTIAR